MSDPACNLLYPARYRPVVVLTVLWLTIIACNVTANETSGNVHTDAAALYQLGDAAYERDDYATAIAVLEKATELEPTRSHYFHLLGKSYGKLANESNWFSAMNLSQKTLQALERAVELDPTHDQAKIDLIKFYRQAPGFLGGDEKKADELEKQLGNAHPPTPVSE